MSRKCQNRPQPQDVDLHAIVEPEGESPAPPSRRSTGIPWRRGARAAAPARRTPTGYPLRAGTAPFAIIVAKSCSSNPRNASPSTSVMPEPREERTARGEPCFIAIDAMPKVKLLEVSSSSVSMKVGCQIVCIAPASARQRSPAASRHRSRTAMRRSPHRSSGIPRSRGYPPPRRDGASGSCRPHVQPGVCGLVRAHCCITSATPRLSGNRLRLARDRRFGAYLRQPGGVLRRDRGGRYRSASCRASKLRTTIAADDDRSSRPARPATICARSVRRRRSLPP